MLLSLTLILLFQGHDHEGSIKFEPISAGNSIDVGHFEFIIPDGVLYADETNVHHMFRLTGAEYIPNCVGMFAGASGTWEYSITVQHYPSQAFSFSPILGQDLMHAFFSQVNLLTLKPKEGVANVLMPAEFDLEKQSVSLGMQYVYPDGELVNCMKKIWVTGEDALIFTLMATEPGFEGDFDQISAVFTSVELKEGSPKTVSGPDTVPYYELFGMNLSQTEPKEEEISLVPSLILIGGALALLIIAFWLKKKKPETSSAA